MGRTLKELREAQGLTYEDLALRINLDVERFIEATLRESGEDLRAAQARRVRDQAIERWSVDARTVERWEKFGFDVQNETRAAVEFYSSPTFNALLRVLNAKPDDLDRESSNVTL